MIRKQVYLRQDQQERLKAAAAASGRTEAELIREAIDRVLAEREATKARHDRHPDDWKRAIFEAAGVWADRDDIDEIMAEGRAGRDRRFEELMRQWRGRRAGGSVVRSLGRAPALIFGDQLSRSAGDTQAFGFARSQCSGMTH